MVHILDNPAHGGDDLTDLIYDQPSIERFKSLSRECAAVGIIIIYPLSRLLIPSLLESRSRQTGSVSMG